MMPKLIMTREQFFEITYLTKKCSQEISGLGTLIINEEGNFEVEKLFLLDQEVSSAATDLDAKSVSKCMYEAREYKGTLSFWWHSHVNMSAFFSGTDISTIKDHAKHGMFVGLVINKKGEYQIAMGLQSPKIYVDKGLALEIKESIDDNLIFRLDKEYKEKVKERTYNHGGYYGRSSHYLGIDSSGGYDSSYPEPLVYDEKLGKYVDNPEFIKAKRQFRKEKHNRQESRKNRNKTIPLSIATGAELSDFQKLGCEEQNKLFKEFISFYGYNPNNEEQLAIFYAENKTLLGRI